ncbi:MAG: sugar ABC transporter substrate-binding protein [Ktedonobacteraceae bacterium]|nr:sugar ABC transporter substrate-binding protein [Ktedonobacteraceae bacterium]
MRTTSDLGTPQSAGRISRREVLKLGGTVATTAFAAPAILSACGGVGGGSAAGSSKTVHVYWNAGHNYDAYKQVISQFEKDHPGWQVKLELYQWPDMRTKVLANFAGKDVPDLIEEPGGWIQEFGRQGKLLSLQQYINKDGKEIGFPDDWQAYTVSRNSINNEVYGIQLHLTCILVFYNKDMVQKAGITTLPTTWDEFLDAAKALTKDNVYGVSLNQDPGYSWPWYVQNQVQYYDPDKKVITMDTENAIAALQFQADLVQKYKVSPVPVISNDYSGPQKLLSAKRAAFILTGPWDIKPIQSGSPDLNWGITQALKQKTQATTAAGTSLMIPKDAKNPDMAWDLLKRFVALKTEIAATKEAGMTMPRKSWGTSAEIKALNNIAPFTEGLNYAQYPGATLEATGKSGAVSDLYKKAYQDVIYRNQPVADALKEFVAAANKAIAQ